LANNVKDNRVRMMVTNTTMGRDPQYGVPKELRVRYSSNGHLRDVTVPENAELKLPQ
jgi:hypothetical protein